MTKDPASPADDSSSPRGADLAREALAAARQRNAATRGSRVGNGRRAGSGGDAQASLRLRRRRWSGPGNDPARDPQRFGDMASQWVKRNGSGEITKARIFARWAEIVGAAVADHCEPVEFRGGELMVQAESTAWATQLRLMAPSMIDKINADVGSGTVRRINTKGPAGPSWRFGNRHVRGRGPRDTYG